MKQLIACVREVIKKRGIDISTAADECKISRATTSRLLAGHHEWLRPPTQDLVFKWLTEHGSSFDTNISSPHPSGIATSAPRFGNVIPDDPSILEQTEVPEAIEDHKRLASFRASDSSMLPDIHEGDIIFFCPDLELRPGNTALVKYDGNVLCKLWFPQGDLISLSSTSPGIPPIIIKAQEVLWAYRAIMVKTERKLA